MNLLPLTIPDKKNNTEYWGNMHGASKALSIIHAAEQHKNLILVITEDAKSANQLINELNFFKKKHTKILLFPDWETLPYDNFSPHQDIVSTRLKILYSLPHLEQAIVIAPVASIMQHLCPKQYLLQHSLILKIGDNINQQNFSKQISQSGYQHVSQVMTHGEYTVRGSLVDIYPMGTKLPFRIDLLDDEIDTIRTFSPENQRTIEKINEIILLPAKEYPLNETSIRSFRTQFRELFPGNPTQCQIYKNTSEGLPSAGIEYYLPLFFENTNTFIDYLPSNTLLFHINNIFDSAKEFSSTVESRYKNLSIDILRPILKPKKLFLSAEELFHLFKNFNTIKISDAELSKSKQNNIANPLPINFKTDNKTSPLLELDKFIVENPTIRIIITAETKGRREVLLQSCTNLSIQPKAYENWQDFMNDKFTLGICLGNLEQGLYLPNSNILLITEAQIFGKIVLQQRRKQKTKTNFEKEYYIYNLSELNIGDPIVHIDHGVGRYLGLMTLDIHGNEQEFVSLAYKGDDKLYIPITDLHLISRFSAGNIEHAPLDRLGSDSWQRAKKKAEAQINDVACELLDLQSLRASKKGIAFEFNQQSYSNFSNAFPFEETDDQLTAIEAVLSDLQNQKPMDRLICGDVGFGKTEVAMRAAYIVANSGFQVAILVPTTLLAQQHYENFSDRFAELPINVRLLSRFISAKNQIKTIHDLATGKIDIIIGTHKLIQSNIKFHKLGLIIIDEEHRFGVKQKENLKKLRADVDILTLTATPIPRTLNFAMSGLRDLSIIATPPMKRLSIKTFVREYSDALIKEAIMRELRRGGQIYFVHNEVTTIEQKTNQLRELLPEANIQFAHGQMRERTLEKIMSDFYHLRFNVLVCTTIIETGIDVPTANTMIIDKANKFGLAQLHQLRGRVGRSHHQAYAFLLTPNTKLVTKDAQKRLEAIAAQDALGVGFNIASHDLEIRGAGELLGENQSGHIDTIGFSLYMEMLEQALKAIKNNTSFKFDLPYKRGVEIDLDVSAILPEKYIRDISIRLNLYKRIANIKQEKDFKDLQIEMIDRFGLLPQQAKNLFIISKIKLTAQQLGISKIRANKQDGCINFIDKPNIATEKLLDLIQNKAHIYSLSQHNRLKFVVDMPDMQTRVNVIENTLAEITK